MSAELFCFLQVELPFALGPPDGRWLIRGDRNGEVERVVVLRTVGAGRADAPSRRRRPVAAPGGGGAQEPDRAGESVRITRATVIDPRTVADEREADGWLGGLDPEHAVEEALGWVNRLLHAHRIAAANHYAHAIGTEHALAVRAGFGTGEHVAEGRWLRALTLPAPRMRRRGRKREAAKGARVHERLAALLGNRSQALLCEELALRARLDLDEGRPRLAAIELERAYATAIVELRELSPGTAGRLLELRDAKAEVTQLALAALALDTPFAEQSDALETALHRLEAALRARSRQPRPDQ